MEADRVKPLRIPSKRTGGISKASTTEKCASTLISDGSIWSVSSVVYQHELQGYIRKVAHTKLQDFVRAL